jgi:Phage protein (N4 Gp49/phage Sf6 gene 66) family
MRRWDQLSEAQRARFSAAADSFFKQFEELATMDNLPTEPMNLQPAEAMPALGPTITKEGIEALIRDEKYIEGFDTTVTICVLTLRNGFVVVGHSACASPANFNLEIGKRLAREHAVRQVWPLEGYLLREKLSQP